MSSKALPVVDRHGPGPDRLIHIGTAFLCLAWVAVVLRVGVRTCMIRSFGADDWFMIVTMAFFTASCIFMIVIGILEKASDVNTLEHIARLVSFVIGFTSVYCMTMVFLKISLALFYLRIVVENWQKYTIYATLAFYTVVGTFYTFISVFRCGDPNRYLYNLIGNKCLDESLLQSLAYMQNSFNAATDLVYAVLPMFVLRTAKLPAVTKISAYSLLALGTTGGIASLVRFKYIDGLKPGTHFFTTSVDIMVWSLIEPGLGITAASLATLRPLLRGFVEKARGITPTLGSSTRHGGSSKLRGNKHSGLANHGSIQMTPVGVRMSLKNDRAGFRQIDEWDQGKRVKERVETV